MKAVLSGSCLVLAIGFANYVQAEDHPTTQATKQELKLATGLVTTLNRIGVLYHQSECNVIDQAKSVVSACTSAFNNPQTIETKNNVSCVFDSETMTVTTIGSTPQPEFHVSLTGDILQIKKGDLSVDAADCKVMESKREPSEVHPANEDLCLSYFPDKYFIKFQSESECPKSKDKSDQAPLAVEWVFETIFSGR